MRIFLPASPHMFRDYCAQRSLHSVSKKAKVVHVRCNFVRIRYGGVGVNFVRESTIVCLSAHVMQNAFLSRPDVIGK